MATELKKDIHFTFKNLKDQCDDKYPQLEKDFIENFLQSSPLATPPSSTKIGVEVLRTSWEVVETTLLIRSARGELDSHRPVSRLCYIYLYHNSL